MVLIYIQHSKDELHRSRYTHIIIGVDFCIHTEAQNGYDVSSDLKVEILVVSKREYLLYTWMYVRVCIYQIKSQTIHLSHIYVCMIY